MTSFDYRLDPIYAIKECSSCGSLYTSNCGCSKGSLDDKILVSRTPDSYQQPLPKCARCETPIDGPYCRGCALLRKKFKEDWFAYCVENFQDFEDTSESSDDNTNVVNAPREPIVVNQNPDDTITITPVLPIEEPDNSLSMGDEHLDTIPATESDEFIKSSVEDLVPIPSESEGITSDVGNRQPLEVVEIVDPEVGRIDDDILLTIKDDILREKLLNINLLIAKIDALRDNPTPSSEVVIKSTSTFPNLFLEETNTFDNSIPESETFRFNLEEISSGSPTHYSFWSNLFLIITRSTFDNDIFKRGSSAVPLLMLSFLNMIVHL
ncbi:hypothetical protein Tco_0920564 [Tanacetum coccineum]